jgi:Bacterial EndoU nuclease
MALDDPYGEAADDRGDVRPERRLVRAPDTHTPPGGRDPAEPRSREEYSEALRGGKPVHAQDGDGAESRTGGWSVIDAQRRPRLDVLRVGPERTAHILGGDNTGGGHRHGTGSPGKTEFPASWDDEKIIGNILDVARRPDSPPVHQQWNARWLCTGTRDNVEISVVIQRSGEVWTAWPEEGSPGVRRNPREAHHD